MLQGEHGRLGLARSHFKLFPAAPGVNSEQTESLEVGKSRSSGTIVSVSVEQSLWRQLMFH